MFFIDESGDPGESGSAGLVVAGLILNDIDWPKLKARFDEVKSNYGINPTIEVKWSNVRNRGSNKNPLRALTDRERTDFGRAVLSLVRTTKFARVIGIIIDKKKAYQRVEISTPDNIYERAVSLAMERYQYYLRAARVYGIVVQDQRAHSQDRLLRAFYQSLFTTGTQWTRFPNIIEGVFLSPSDLSTGLQIADFIAGSFYVAHCTAKKDPKYFNIIRGKVTGDPKIGKRHGFKQWP